MYHYYYFGKQIFEFPVLVIPRLDRGIQFFQYVLDCPVKSDADLREESLRPDNDDSKVFTCRG